MFHMDVVFVLSECYKSRSSVAYVAMAIHVCCKCMFVMFQLFCFRRMLQVFYLDVAYVAVAMHICYKSMF
jgi:hypothetical protein